MSGSFYQLNQKYNQLLALIKSIPTSYNLTSVLTAGNGGNGLSSSITGTATFRGGGGGGGHQQNLGGTRGLGGTGGGGNGGLDGSTVATSGTANTGGGGGGAGGDGVTFFPGGAGGSGSVIIRFPSFI